MAQPTDIDWPREISVLRQLLPMATTVHVLTTDVLLRRFRQVHKKPDGHQEAKVLAIKLIAEAMSALEDFGALCRAVRLRGDGGLLWNYRKYGQGEISEVYKAIQEAGKRPVALKVLRRGCSPTRRTAAASSARSSWSPA